MKRLVSAAIVAIGMHSLLMVMDFGWMHRAGVEKLPAGSVTVTLEAIQPQTTTPRNAPVPSHRSPRRERKPDLKTAPQADPPATPPVPQKPVEVARQPKKKPPPVKPVPAEPDRPAEQKKPAPPASLESLPGESSSGNEAPLPSPQEEAATQDTGPVAAVSDPPAPVLEQALPEYSKNPPIVYPRRARQKGYQGTVLLEVLVNRIGTVDDLRILASSGYAILDRSAIKTVKTWSFKPAKKGKNPIDMWVQVPVRFNLQ